MKAGELMSTTLVVVPPEMPAASVAELLSARGISAVPVVDAGGAPVGIVTEGDLIRRLADEPPGPVAWFFNQFRNPKRLAERFVKAHGATARDVMTKDLVTVGEDASAEEIARLMEERRIKRVPVVRDGRLVGIVSRADLLRAVLRPNMTTQPAETSEDGAILRAVLAAMREQPWVDTFWTYADVRDGVVSLHGFARSDVIREGLRLLIQNIPGVKRVEDHMSPMPLMLRATL
ncbi:MAG: CBS domain-containing protein [Acetobacteraceae bacterium]|nr:CBS domain-containing protein [Acetobacteraceae bacterium]